MNRIEMSFVEFHNPFFMQGTNLGTKMFAKQKNATLFYDLDHSFMIITFKGRVALVPSTNIVSMDVIDYSSLNIQVPNAVIAEPTAVLPETETNMTMSEDELAALQHRKEVRERSANSNRAPTIQETTNRLIQSSRAQALGMKHSAQIDNPTRPAQGQTGKNKIMSHAQLKAQIAMEAKDVKPA